MVPFIKHSAAASHLASSRHGPLVTGIVKRIGDAVLPTLKGLIFSHALYVFHVPPVEIETESFAPLKQRG